MKYYKLKTVAFYVFVATVMSFDLKGGENENEGICSCCNCCKEEEKKEEEKKGGEKEKKVGKKKKKKKKKKEEEIFILRLKLCFSRAIGKINKNVGDNKEEEDKINEEQEKQKVEKDKTKKRLFIVDLKNVLREIIFEKLDDKLSYFLLYKENLNDTLPLDNLSLISYCSKNENNKDFKICAFKIKSDSTINDVFEYFKDASTWVNDKKNCLILFIKDQNGSIVSLES